MPLDPQILAALNSDDPFGQLRSLVRTLQSQGKDQAVILQLFEQARQQLRAEGRAHDEDVLMDVMDCLVGWCSPPMSLKPE
jgi:hypothetical protein